MIAACLRLVWFRFEKWAELFGQTLYAVSAKATALTDLQTVRRNVLSCSLLHALCLKNEQTTLLTWLGSRVVSVLDSGAEGPGFKSQPRRCRVTVLGKLFTPVVPLFTKQQNR